MRDLRFAIVVAAVLATACGTLAAGHAERRGESRAAAAAAQNAPGVKVLGTIRATVDGAARTWYVVSGVSGGRPYASGAWQEIVSGRRRIILGGYDTATPPLDSFEWNANGMPRSYGTFKGSTMGLMFEVAASPGPFRATIPDSQASVIYASPAKLDSMDTTFMSRQGVIDVTAVSLTGGLVSVTGTFSGTLARMTGEGTTAITGGTFEANAMPNLATLLKR
jgi:hypothetical protein